MKDDLKKITVLHSNDIHGKFTGQTGEDGKLRGSLAQVGGYVSKVKKENPNTAYCIAGDVFQGSLIDSDFQGLSTISILNLIDIDVMSIGNHELDYGISHMLFAGRYANFPVINANFIIKTNKKHLFKPYHMVEMDGLNVLFIGLITKDIIDTTKAEGLVGTYVMVEDAENSIRHTLEAVKTRGMRADIIILLTHIGWEADLELAERLDPELGVNVIIGGHSHTYIDEPAVINDIAVLQCGFENTDIGRFDIFYDEEKGRIDSWKWEMIPVDDDHCPTDKYVKAMTNTYVMDIDEKYRKVVTRFRRPLDNFGRGNPTEVGQLFADAFADALGIDLMIMASSSTRCYSMDMTVTLQDLREAYPYDGKIFKVRMSGAMLRRAVMHIMRAEVLEEWEEAFFHFSKRLHIDFNYDTKKLDMKFDGKPLDDERVLNVGMQEFYFLNAEMDLNIGIDEFGGEEDIVTASFDAFETLRGYLSEHQGLGSRVDDRCIIRGDIGGNYRKVNKHEREKRKNM